MPKVALLNQTGSQVGEIELAEAIFGTLELVPLGLFGV